MADYRLEPGEWAAIVLAASALRYRIDGHTETAYRAVSKLNGRCGGDGINLAMRFWIDQFLVLVPIGPDDPFNLHIFDASTGGFVDIDSASIESAWAVRMILARHADDVDNWNALREALPPDPNVIGRHVAALLDCVAATIWNHDRAVYGEDPNG